jgi:hypothetical protein
MYHRESVGLGRLRSPSTTLNNSAWQRPGLYRLANGLAYGRRRPIRPYAVCPGPGRPRIRTGRTRPNRPASARTRPDVRDVAEKVDSDEIHEPSWRPGCPPGISFPFHSQSYLTEPPPFAIVATASRWMRALRTSQPSVTPITSTTMISPRTVKRRNLRQERERGAAGMLAGRRDWLAFKGDALARLRSYQEPARFD